MVPNQTDFFLSDIVDVAWRPLSPTSRNDVKLASTMVKQLGFALARETYATQHLNWISLPYWFCLVLSC